ncbi:MAG: LysM peptidoglycan-binding domain-containing protein [Salinivirgaceae bacterium]|nr:LysM peptidoglycan-binding domain-containing protein [Salinivirgaceae bacterium]
MNNKISLSFGSKSDAGREKEFNTDSIIDFPILNGHVFVVCDGHDGEHGHGALASRMTVESIKKYFYNKSYKDIQKALTNAVSYANYSLFEQSKKDSKYAGIGSTLAILIYREGKVYYAYAGDSRIYLYKKNSLQVLTRDHVEDVENFKDSEVAILIGKAKDIKFGVCKNPLEVNEEDGFLICTDGLSDYLSIEEITEVVSDENTAAAHKVVQLVEKVNDKGGEDNVSVHILEFGKPAELEKITKRISVKRLAILAGFFIVIVVVSLSIIKFKDSFFADNKTNNKISKKEVVKLEKKDVSTTVNPNTEKVVEEPVKIKNKKKQVLEETVKKQEVVYIKTPKYYKHHIQFGDNLYRLSLRYNVSQQKIIDINKEKAKNLIAGSYINIPVIDIYTVKTGESYSVISDKFNVKIKLICTANIIDQSQPLKEGQKLIIPIP